jgi:hypothetical protein
MFKLAAVFLLCVVACHGFLANVGGYKERPELIEDAIVGQLANFATSYLSTAQNLLLQHLRVVRVQTQVVNGLNYKIEFVAEPVEGVAGQTTTCEVVINVSFQSVKNVLQANCQTI